MLRWRSINAPPSFVFSGLLDIAEICDNNAGIYGEITELKIYRSLENFSLDFVSIPEDLSPNFQRLINTRPY